MTQSLIHCIFERADAIWIDPSCKTRTQACQLAKHELDTAHDLQSDQLIEAYQRRCIRRVTVTGRAVKHAG